MIIRQGMGSTMRGPTPGCCYGGMYGVNGLGLFESGLDLTGWGVTEWVVAAAAVYLALKLFGDVRRVRGASRQRRRATVQAKRKRLQRELDLLGQGG